MVSLILAFCVIKVPLAQLSGVVDRDEHNMLLKLFFLAILFFLHLLFPKLLLEAMSSIVKLNMYHFAWADQREKQGYKSNVSPKRGIQLVKGMHIIAT